MLKINLLSNKSKTEGNSFFLLIAILLFLCLFTGIIYGEPQPTYESAQQKYSIGHAYIAEKKYDMALQYLKDASKIYWNLGKVTELINTYETIAFVYVNQKDYDNAIKYYQKVFIYYEKGDKLSDLARIHCLMAQIYVLEKNNKDALNLYQKAVDIYNKLQSEREIANICLKIGDICFTSRDYNCALINYCRGKLLFKKFNERKQEREASYKELNTLLTYANSLYQTGKLDMAIDTYKEAAKLAYILQDNQKQLLAFSSIANIYFKQKKVEEASIYYQKVINIISIEKNKK